MRVAKWGNSFAVRLPAAVVEALGIRDGDDIEIQVAGARAFEVRMTPDNLELLEYSSGGVDYLFGVMKLPDLGDGEFVNVDVRYVVAGKLEDHSRLLIEISYDVKASHDRRSLVYPFYLIPDQG